MALRDKQSGAGYTTAWISNRHQGLFNSLLDAIADGNWAVFPPGERELITEASRSAENVRTVADFIASMSEPQALELYQRLMGISMGSFLKNIV